MWRDEALLLDMLLASRKIHTYSRGLDFARFENDEMLQDAVMRRIFIIGEAASKVSPEFNESRPEIPWIKIVGMRNRLIHDYNRVITETVWEVVEQDVLQLIAFS
jgi:uncharacterized protein with HEPN domain